MVRGWSKGGQEGRDRGKDEVNNTVPWTVPDAKALAERSAEASTGYDPHRCEYCGKLLADPGISFLLHLDESEDCRWLWRAYLPYVHEDAGAD